MEKSSFQRLDFDHFGPVDGLKEDDIGPSWTAEEETAVRRKLDWHIVPVVTLLYLLCFVCTKHNTIGLTYTYKMTRSTAPI
jgi:hypothetical protein